MPPNAGLAAAPYSLNSFDCSAVIQIVPLRSLSMSNLIIESRSHSQEPLQVALLQAHAHFLAFASPNHSRTFAQFRDTLPSKPMPQSYNYNTTSAYTGAFAPLSEEDNARTFLIRKPPTSYQDIIA
jgi:hypothetical protein